MNKSLFASLLLLGTVHSQDILINDSNAQTCDDNGLIDVGNNIYFLNNKWGYTAATEDSYECITETSNTYHWTPKTQDGQVKGYAAYVKGWHYGVTTGYRYGQGAGGLPARIYDRPSIMGTWRISHSRNEDREVLNTSWDIWLGHVDEPNPNTPGGEVMIWLNHAEQYALGSYRETVNIWGMNWDLFVGEASDWTCYSFVNQGNTWDVENVNLYDFFDYLWAQKNYIDGRRYIVGIEAGNEIMQGSG